MSPCRIWENDSQSRVTEQLPNGLLSIRKWRAKISLQPPSNTITTMAWWRTALWQHVSLRAAGCALVAAWTVPTSNPLRPPVLCEAASKSTYQRVPVPDRAFASSHVIFGHLLQDDMVESYHVYRSLDDDGVVVGEVQLGTKLDGHEGVVHGGILALLLDDVMGFGFEALGIPFAVTANLNINYRAPVPSGSAIQVHCTLVERTERKLVWSAVVRSPDAETIYCEATSVFVIPKHVYETMKNETTSGGSPSAS